jgi:hypothetical protein
VVAVANGGVTAIRAVAVRMVCMLRIGTCGHGWPPLLRQQGRNHTKVRPAPPPIRVRSRGPICHEPS